MNDWLGITIENLVYRLIIGKHLPLRDMAAEDHRTPSARNAPRGARAAIGCRGPSAQENKCVSRGQCLNFNKIIRKEGKISDPSLLDVCETRETRAKAVNENVIACAQQDEAVRIVCVDASDEFSNGRDS